MKKELSKFWNGKVSFGQSFWLWYMIGTTVLSLPFWLVPDVAYESDTTAGIMGLYFIILLAVVIFVIIGTWKSAEEYKKIKQRKKQGSGWAIAGQVYIVFHIISFVRAMITG